MVGNPGIVTQNVLPNKEIFILDEEELLQALTVKKITEADYYLANTELNRLQMTLIQGSNDLLQIWETDFRNFMLM